MVSSFVMEEIEGDIGKFSNDLNMLELALYHYLFPDYSQENARCEWKDFKNLKN